MSNENEKVEETQFSEEEKAAILAKRQEREKMLEFMDKIKGLMDEYQMDLVLDQNSPIGNPSIMPLPRKPQAHF